VPRLLAPALPPGCPWSGFTPPNVDWCESEVCGWITNPADTWSNLAYLVFGVAMWRIARASGRPDLRLFAPASVAVGIFSGVYHASYTWMLQFLDFVGMFVFCFVVVTRNALRLGWIGERRQTAFYLAGVAATSAAVPPLFEIGFPIQALVVVLVAVIIGQEIALRSRTARADYRPWFAALALLGAGAVCSILDVTRVWCDPADHFLQGHAAWHVLSAASLFALFRFYQGLPRDFA
jgi:hypothetical protein